MPTNLANHSASGVGNHPAAPAKPTAVGMGEIQAARSPDKLTSVLGSCVGLALIHPRCKAAALAHVVLPDSAGKSGTPGKFADTALPQMLQRLAELGVPPAGLIAKLSGGANMFGSKGPLQIGDQNIHALRAILKKAGIPITGEHVGGNKGRRITLDCTGGDVTVEVAGGVPVTL